MEKRVLNLDECCAFLGYKKSTMYKLVQSNTIPYSKPNGKRLFFDRQLLEDWMLRGLNKTNETLRAEANSL